MNEKAENLLWMEGLAEGDQGLTFPHSGIQQTTSGPFLSTQVTITLDCVPCPGSNLRCQNHLGDKYCQLGILYLPLFG